MSVRPHIPVGVAGEVVVAAVAEPVAGAEVGGQGARGVGMGPAIAAREMAHSAVDGAGDAALPARGLAGEVVVAAARAVPVTGAELHFVY